MPEDLKPTPESPFRQKVNENVIILVHIVYGMSLFLDLWGLLAAVIVFFLTKNLLAKDHLKYIIKTHIIYLVFTMLAVILFGIGSVGVMGLTALSTGDEGGTIIATQGIILGVGILVITFGFLIWYYLRLIGGWIAYFRKEPIQGHFGISLSKK